MTCADILMRDESVETLIESWQPALREFENLRADYLLYQ